MQTSQEARPGGNQALILETATRLMMEQGIQNTSLADIAQATKLSKGTLYYYYASKSELIFDITQRHMDRLTEELLGWIEEYRQQAAHASGETILELVFEKMLGAQTRSKFHLYLVQEAINNEPNLSQRFSQKYQEWQAIIEHEIVKLELHKVDQPALARLILAALDGFIIQSNLGLPEVPVKAVAKLLADSCRYVN